MPSGQPQYDIDQLNRLIEISFDSAEGYHDATAAATSSPFAEMFRKRAAQREEIIERLRAEVQRLGGKAEDGGTVIAAAQRWFGNLKNSIAGSDASIAAHAEAGDEHVRGAFEAALQDGRISVGVRALITAAYTTIKIDHDQVSNMKQEPQIRRTG